MLLCGTKTSSRTLSRARTPVWRRSWQRLGLAPSAKRCLTACEGGRTTSRGPIHFGTSWQDQRSRVGRWHKRLTAIGRGISPELSKDEALDDAFAFFMNCHHLRNWVIGSGFKPEASVDAHIRANPDLALCRDVCAIRPGRPRRFRWHRRCPRNENRSLANTGLSPPIGVTSTCSIWLIDASRRAMHSQRWGE